MSNKTSVPLVMVAWLVACGGGTPPADDATGPIDDPPQNEALEATETPVEAEDQCTGLDETKCKITAGCAWSNESTCVVNTAMGM